MIKFFKTIVICILTGFISSCAQVLQPVALKINTQDRSLQEKFNVIEKTLTITEARAQKNAPYVREVLKNGRGAEARPIPEKLALISNFPENDTPFIYRIGIGDTLTFSKLVENNRSPFDTQDKWPKQQVRSKYKLGIGDTLVLTLIKKTETITPIAPNNTETDQNLIRSSQQNDNTIISTGRIGSDGSVLLLEVGRLEASGKSLNELRSEVRNILIRNGVSPRFQLEISEFQSQKAYLTVNEKSQVIFLADKRTTARDILAAAEVGFIPGVKTRVRLQRDGLEYIMSLRDIFSDTAPEIDIISLDHLFVETSAASIVTNTSVVDNEGSVVFEGVGKIKAVGLSLDELRNKIENLIQQLPDSQNAFQIQITNFASQTALLRIPGQPSGVTPITDTPKALEEVLANSVLSSDGSNITRINLQRKSKSYFFTLDDLLNPNTEKVYLQPNDRVTVETLSYKENKVFILGGVDPQIFTINPTKRETLADILFTSSGVLSSSSAKRSEVYLLRGSNPVIAYHLDAQNPTRLIVADAMELRPNDILYVAEQPIVSFNRTLATILPLRILLRDIGDNNIP